MNDELSNDATETPNCERTTQAVPAREPSTRTPTTRTIRLSSPIADSFRTRSVAGLFDVPLEEKTTKTITFEPPPDVDDDWRIGLIVGPSGSGKTTIASTLYPNDFWRGADWAPDKATIDNFGDRPTNEIVRTLTTVGFGSPPSWVQPFPTLSNGEKFRCELARALLDSPSELVVFDEFTSVVDRTVAKTASAALAKALKSGALRKKFVAVSCHYDVVDWLEPDWVLDVANGRTTRRRLRRPPIELEIVAAPAESWAPFAKHHYLTGSLSPLAKRYLAFWGETPVAFCATLPVMGRKGSRRVSRLVVLPDYQGIGIGSAFLDAIAETNRERGFRFHLTTSHPAFVRRCAASPRWRTTCVRKMGNAGNGRAGSTSMTASRANPAFRTGKPYRGSAGRAVVSFEYVGDSTTRLPDASTRKNNLTTTT